MPSAPTPWLVFVDATIAAALESAEAGSSREFCKAAAELYTSADIQIIPCAGGFGLHYGPSDPLNAVKGVGLNGPVDPAEWDALEAVFQHLGSPVIVDLCPFADDGFVAMLSSRAYTIGSFETVMFRPLNAAPLPHPTLELGAALAVVGPERAAEWTRVLGVGFADGGEPTRFAVDFGLVRARLPHSIMLLATVDGKPAGGAGLSIQGSVAHLAGAAVLPEFRGRSLQQALTAARLAIAQERGCRLAKLDVRAGTSSYRNAVRTGFQIAYTRPQVVRAWKP